MDDEELVRRMVSTPEEFDYQFSDSEYMRAVKFLAKDRESWQSAWRALALASTEVAK